MKPTIVLVHAFPVDHRLWTGVAAGLEAADFRVIAPDLRGFGADRRSLDGTPSLDVFADDIASTIADADGTAVVVGLSLGGYVAMNLAARYPRALAGIVLANTKAEADDSDAQYVRFEFADRVEREGTRWIPDAMMPKLLSRGSREERPDIVSAVSEQIIGNRPSSLAWTQRAMAQRPDSYAVLESLDRPVLVIGAEDDVISPLDGMAHLAEAIDGEMRAIQNVGHLSAIEAPDEFVDILVDWLTRTYGAASHL